MKANTYDYFLNLDKQKLKRENGVIIAPEEVFDLDFEPTMHINNRKYFNKPTFDKLTSIQTIASCNLFHHSGILTPPVYLTKQEHDNRIYQINEDVHRPQFIQCLQPHNMDEYKKFYNSFRYTMNNTWEILYIQHHKDYFLTFMTEDCFNDLMSLFSVDTLRSEEDRNFNNYFFYRYPGSDKFNGVIAIDHDNTNIPELASTYAHPTADSFTKGVKYEFYSRSPMGADLWTSHLDNINNLKNVIVEGRMPLRAIQSTKDALNYDFPNQIKSVGKKYHFDNREIVGLYDMMSYLWEFNRRELEDVIDL